MYLVFILGGVYVPCINRMPGGVIVGDAGLCCCVPTFNVLLDLKQSINQSINVQCVTLIVRAPLLPIGC